MTKSATEPDIQSWAELDACAGELCQVVARQTKIQAQIAEKVAKLRQEHAGDLDDLADRDAEIRAAIQGFCESHHAELVVLRTKKLSHCEVGFHDGKPSVAIKKGWKAPAVLEAIRRFGERLARWIHQPRPRQPTISRQTILDEWAAARTYKAKFRLEQQLDKVGLVIRQPEQFVLLLHTEPLDAK